MIKIKSIERNPNAGVTHLRQLTSQHWKYESSLSPKEFSEKFPRVIVESIESDIGQNRHIISGVSSEMSSEVCDKTWISPVRTYNDVICNPLPEYLIEYEDLQIKCPNCSFEFDFRELESDLFYDCYVSDLCPKCEHSTDVELEFETISQFKERTNCVT